MASEWVGVVGTAIGAGIGGVVTVVSLVVKGRQDANAQERQAEREDRHRAEDRADARRQRNVDERMATYTGMLRRANLIQSNMLMLYKARTMDQYHLSDEDVGKMCASVMDAWIAIGSMEVEVDIGAVDPRVPEAVHSLRNLVGDSMIDVFAGDVDAVEGITEEIEAAVDNLRAACRADLGHEAGAEAGQS